MTAEGGFEAAWRLLVPDDGSGDPVPHWQGTPVVRAVADGLAWDVLLETRRSLSSTGIRCRCPPA